MQIYNLGTDSNAIQYMVITAYELSSTEIDPFKSLETSIDKMYKVAEVFDASTSVTKIKELLKDAPDKVVKYTDMITSGNINGILQDGLDAIQECIEKVDEVFGNTLKNIDGGAEASGDPVAMWVLPLPINLSISLSHNHESSEFTPEQMVDRALIKKGGLMLTSTARQMFPGAVDHIKRMAKFGVEVARRYNYSFDPNQINVYTGTNPHKIILPFRLTPMSESHAEKIIEGILQLKKMMTGEQILTDGMFVKQPYCFKIDFNNDYINKWIGLTDSDLNVLSVTTNLFAEPSAPTYDGMTKSLTFDIELEERRPPRNKE